MKRDMDLVRAILFEIEKIPYTGNPVDVQVDGHSHAEISYHILLLTEAALIASQHTGPSYKPLRLTWDGHEFLDAARNDTMWAKAKETVTKNTGALSLEALKLALSA